MRRLTGCAEGAGEVLAAEQAPGDDDEGGQRYPEDHAENAPEGGAPEKDRYDDHDGMKPRLLPHDLGGQVVTLDQLDDHEGSSATEQHRPFPGFGNSAGLEVGNEEGGTDPNDGTEVRYDVEQAEEQTKGDPELQTAEREPDRIPDAHEQSDHQLAPEEGDHDAHELANQKDHVLLHRWAQKA